jgi:putative membrane protein
VLALSVVPAFAQSNGSSADRDRAEKTDATHTMRADETFVTKAAKGGMAEVEFGKLAAERASSPEVKQFGQKMVDDHSRANDELKSIASQKNIMIPAALDAKDKATYNRLSKLSGAAFDRAYMKDMVSDHKTDISEFQYESRSGADSDVRGFATKTLPTLQEHLKMAEDANGAVATTGSRMARPAGTTGTK